MPDENLDDIVKDVEDRGKEAIRTIPTLRLPTGKDIKNAAQYSALAFALAFGSAADTSVFNYTVGRVEELMHKFRNYIRI